MKKRKREQHHELPPKTGRSAGGHKIGRSKQRAVRRRRREGR